MKRRGLYALVLIGMLVIFVFVAIAALLYAAYTLVSPSDCVGVVHIDGEISTEESGGGLLSSGTVGSTQIASEIKDLEGRNDVKAVVFEINSPGGSVVATREIYQAIREYPKPKVAYFREIAASGGYYAAVGTDYIISDPDALTGSIGVIATFEDLSGLFNKLGINYTILKSGEVKDMGEPSRPLTDKEKAIMQGIINETFDEFKSTVEENRGAKLNATAFNEILDARVLTGRQAQKIGLVDDLGNMDDAVRKAADMANMSYTDMPRVCDVGGSDFFTQLFGQAANTLAKALSGGTALDASGKVGLQYR